MDNCKYLESAVAGKTIGGAVAEKKKKPKKDKGGSAQTDDTIVDAAAATAKGKGRGKGKDKGKGKGKRSSGDDCNGYSKRKVLEAAQATPHAERTLEHKKKMFFAIITFVASASMPAVMLVNIRIANSFWMPLTQGRKSRPQQLRHIPKMLARLLRRRLRNLQQT